MQKRMIVTHRYPDVDAAMSVWLVMRFGGKRWDDADIEFVRHGDTFDGADPDSSDEVMHVDTGGGRFDHHHSNERTCAAKKVYEWLVSEFDKEDPILERMVSYALAIDHFDDATWHEPLSDVYDFGFCEMLDGVHEVLRYRIDEGRDRAAVEWALLALDSVYERLNSKVKAMEQLSEVGLEVSTRFGKAIAIQTFNDDTIRVALKQGYVAVLRRDPQKKYVRIKAHPQSAVDLTHLYHTLKAMDPEATWYLHADKRQLLNGNSGDKDRVVTELEWEELVELLQKI